MVICGGVPNFWICSFFFTAEFSHIFCWERDSMLSACGGNLHPPRARGGGGTYSVFPSGVSEIVSLLCCANVLSIILILYALSFKNIFFYNFFLEQCFI